MRSKTKSALSPLSYRQIDPKSVSAELQKSNWILFTQLELFDFAFRQLLFALDTDLDYWHQSARLLTNAKEWEKKGQELSTTLRGKELKAAERWLAEGAKKTPPPGSPVTDFIAAGIKTSPTIKTATDIYSAGELAHRGDSHLVLPQ